MLSLEMSGAGSRVCCH